MLQEKLRENVRRKGALELTGLPGKLADCQINKQEGTELIYCRGRFCRWFSKTREEIGQIKQFYL